jgi:hypothetical protein
VEKRLEDPVFRRGQQEKQCPGKFDSRCDQEDPLHDRECLTGCVCDQGILQNQAAPKRQPPSRHDGQEDREGHDAQAARLNESEDDDLTCARKGRPDVDGRKAGHTHRRGCRKQGIDELHLARLAEWKHQGTGAAQDCRCKTQNEQLGRVEETPHTGECWEESDHLEFRGVNAVELAQARSKYYSARKMSARDYSLALNGTRIVSSLPAARTFVVAALVLSGKERD